MVSKEEATKILGREPIDKDNPLESLVGAKAEVNPKVKSSKKETKK